MSVGGTLRRRLLGLLLIVVLVGFFALTIAKYDKAFQSAVMVTLHTDRAGNQLQKQSDVKVDGVRVGEVRAVTASRDGANMTLAIEPAMAKKIPGNVEARLLPKTLFGEKYVALELPATPSGTYLSAGDHITQDRSKAAVETEQALNDLMPVLQAVQPRKLSETLTALSTALRGRGAELGQTIKQIGSYVGELNPQLPTLEHDLAAFADVARTYSEVTPHLAKALDDLTTTSRTLVQQRANLSALFATLNTTSTDLRDFLGANESNLIAVAGSSKPTLQVLARYSPEFPCLFHGFTKAIPLLDKAWGKGTNQPGLHATLEITVNRGPYKPGLDTPRYVDNRGPRCYDLDPAPYPFPQTPPDGPVKDGASQPTPARTQSDGVIPAGNGTKVAANSPNFGSTSTQSAGGTTAKGSSLGLPNSPAERKFIAGLMAPVLGTSPANVPGWSSALLGPLLRGSEVSLR